MSESQAPRELSPLKKFLFSLGTFGNSGPMSLTVQLQLYFTKYLGYPADVFGVVRGASLAFDAVLDPLMGYVSDNTRSRFGRRMPWIAVGSFVFAAGTIGVFYAPKGLSTFQLYAFLLSMQLLLTVGITMTGVPYSALIPELAPTYQARNSLVSWMQMGIYIGTCWGALVNAYGTWRGDRVAGYKEFAIYCSVAMLLAYWALVLTIREPALPEKRGDTAGKSLGEVFAAHLRELGRSLKFALTDRQFLILFLSVFTYQAGILAGLWMYTFLLDDWFGGSWETPFAQAWLVGPLEIFRDAFFLYIFFAVGGGILFLPFWNWLSKRIEKRTCLMIGIAGVGLTYGSSYFLFAPKSFPLLIVYCFLQAFFYCPANIFPQSMLADVASHSQWKTGEANEGMFFGANSLLVKLYNAVGIAWNGFALTYIVHYKGGEGAVQTPEALERMRLLYAFPAVITAFLALFILARYQLDRAAMGRVLSDLDRGPTGRLDGD
jgi:GPH family glycoside/pentoside/hexuronide:cation symporter